MMRSFISSALMNLKPYSYLLELITVLRMRSPNIVFLIQLSLAVVVVMWSACSTSTPTIRVRIPLTSTVYSVKFVFEKNENKQKRPGLAHFKKRLGRGGGQMVTVLAFFFDDSCSNSVQVYNFSVKLSLL